MKIIIIIIEFDIHFNIQLNLFFNYHNEKCYNFNTIKKTK